MGTSEGSADWGTSVRGKFKEALTSPSGSRRVIPLSKPFISLVLRVFLLGAMGALMSCTKDDPKASLHTKSRGKKVVALDPIAGEAAMYDRYTTRMTDLQKDEKGNFVGAVRSQYDGKNNIAFGGSIGKAQYNAKNYRAKQWNGNLRAQAAKYAGALDGSRYKVPSRYSGLAARQSAQGSAFNGQAARTGSYSTGAARESVGQRLAKPTDAYTNFRREVYPEPPMMSKAEYDRLTVEQSRSLLGRD